MRILFITLLCVAFFGAQAQTVNIDNAYNTSKIDTVVNTALSKAQAYDNALSYIQNTSKFDPKFITIADQAAGEIIFTGNVSKEFIKHKKANDKGTLEQVRLYYKATIYTKDQKFKIVLNSLEYQYGIINASSILTNSVNYLINRTSVAPNVPDNDENNTATELAIWLTKDAAQKININAQSNF
jgi:hypothetical protein